MRIYALSSGFLIRRDAVIFFVQKSSDVSIIISNHFHPNESADFAAAKLRASSGDADLL